MSMSVYNTVWENEKYWKQTSNLKKLYISFYFIVVRIFCTSTAVSFGRTTVFCFHAFYFLLVGLFDWGYSRMQFFIRCPPESVGFYTGEIPKSKVCYQPCLNIHKYIYHPSWAVFDLNTWRILFFFYSWTTYLRNNTQLAWGYAGFYNE